MPHPHGGRAADPSLTSQELLVRASARLLAKRDACARNAIDVTRAHDPSNAHAAAPRGDGPPPRAVAWLNVPRQRRSSEIRLFSNSVSLISPWRGYSRSMQM